MRHLLDTKVFLWMMAEPDRIGPRTMEILGKDGPELYLSAASAWEIAIKFRLGRVQLPQRPLLYVPERMAAAQIHHLPIDARHALAASQLDDHHTDPIDRLLVCQAKEERMRLISSDPSLDTYGIDVLDART
jgi:PIN domain nuclease of toxin-antitoxin system